MLTICQDTSKLHWLRVTYDALVCIARIFWVVYEYPFQLSCITSVAYSIE